MDQVETKAIALPIVAVKITAPMASKTIETYALLDQGSTNSFVSKGVLDSLGVTGVKQRVSLTTLEKANTILDTEIVSSLEVLDMTGNEMITLPPVYAKQTLPISKSNLATVGDIANYPHLAGIKLPTAHAEDIGLLIGQDAPDALIPLDIIKGNIGQPWASRTKLGWTLNGPLNSKRPSSITANFIRSDDIILSNQVERFWKIDGNGLFDDNKGMSVEDKRVIDLWEKNGKHDDGHYQFDIPFRDTSLEITSNRAMAEKRLIALGRRLDRDVSLQKRYRAEMEGLIKKGYVVKCKDHGEENKTWYLPHHPVLNAKKPDKLRIVFDCAAQHKGVSLNETAMQGPDLTNSLLGVLIRFRQDKIAIASDICEAFMQLVVPDNQRDMLSFLWWPDGDTTSRPERYHVTRHVFGSVWAPSCCGYAIKRVADEFGDEFSEITRKAVKTAFYVDDLLASASTTEDAVQLCKELKLLLAKGGFNLTKWISNNPEVVNAIPESDRSKSLRDLALNMPACERALGVYWDVQNDNFTFKISLSDKPPTKRGILSTLSSIFDPLGIVSPFILKARKLVQELFRIKIPWDDKIPPALEAEWENWKRDVPNLEMIHIPRCFKIEHGDVIDTQLHHFGDASETSYGAVSYLRI